MDLIDRQAAIDAVLKGKVDEDESLVECPAECNAMIDGAVEDIKALPSAHPEMDEWCTDCKEYDSERHCCPRFGRVIRHTLDEVAPRWIPVTKRLPEVDIPVLVTDDAGGWATIEVDKCGVYDESDERFWYTSQNVTAWMPLPEPWKGE